MSVRSLLCPSGHLGGVTAVVDARYNRETSDLETYCDEMQKCVKTEHHYVSIDIMVRMTYRWDMPQSIGKNAIEVFRALRSAPKSRLELASATGWSRNTVAKRLDELMAEGWVCESEPDSAGRGRPYAQYQMNPKAAVVYAAVFGWHQLTGALCRLDGTPLVTDESPVNLDETQDVLPVLLAQLERLSANPLVDGSRIVAGALGGPSSVANRITTGAWAQSPQLALELPARLGIPFQVENDANAMALGLRRTYPHVDSYIFVKVATGIGAGIVAGGRILRGVDGLAGEVGHIPIPRANSQPCGCGNRGCVSLVTNSQALMRRLSTPEAPVNNLEQVRRLVLSGDGNAAMALREAGQALGEALVGVITAVAPELIILGGRMTQFGDHFSTGVREVITTMTLPAISSRIRVDTVPDHHAAGIQGAADLAVDQFLGG